MLAPYSPCLANKGREIFTGASILLQFQHKLGAEVQTVDEGAFFVCQAEIADDIEYVLYFLERFVFKEFVQCTESFHDLRHLCASIMLMQGVNVKVAQERLGHADISTTLNIYSHVLPSSAKEAAEKIGAMVYEGVAV